MASKESHRQRAGQRKRMLAAAVRRAERKGNSLDATWARAQFEMRTGDVYESDAALTEDRLTEAESAKLRSLFGGDAA